MLLLCVSVKAAPLESLQEWTVLHHQHPASDGDRFLLDISTHTSQYFEYFQFFVPPHVRVHATPTLPGY